MPDPELDESEYLLYEVIQEHQRQGQKLPETQFHKLSFLAKKEIEDSGEDITLPVYWYEHGMMVDLEELITSFVNIRPYNYESGRGKMVTIDDDIDPDDFDVKEDKRELIHQIAYRLTQKYRNVFDTSVAKDRTYDEFADNDFIICLNDFRNFLSDCDGQSGRSLEDYIPLDVSIDDFTPGSKVDERSADFDADQALQYLDEMVQTYPEDKYEHMHPLFVEWESLTRQFIYNELIDQLTEFTSDFWNTFSRVELRIHHNEDISPMKIHRWRGERDEHIEDFQEKLEKHRKVLLSNREPTSELDLVKEEYSDAVEQAYQDKRKTQ